MTYPSLFTQLYIRPRNPLFSIADGSVCVCRGGGSSFFFETTCEVDLSLKIPSSSLCLKEARSTRHQLIGFLKTGFLSLAANLGYRSESVMLFSHNWGGGGQYIYTFRNSISS